ncbi:MAG: hypothetical protein GWM92_14600, partial [Gemmatimonadetes bacterium]|nr:hypothetical protein [Gemmatimonadota bacterium]NIT88696.1 hypothetical protein [Gemmatimonadota bacterium]NIU73499.1 hypothetical protein [Gammaproteobacteria bacterium]NIY07908.1 hypothetical protein [Gemmatimonadota bacterium]NIY40615.1 hypothetical protein [Gemmatimonadota bacterium]
GFVGGPDQEGLRSSTLEWEDEKVVVVTVLDEPTETPQEGSIDFRFKGLDGGNKTASVDFGIDASGQCFVGELTGNAVAAFGLTLTDGCRQVGSEWEFHVVVDGVPLDQQVSFTAETTHDTVNPSKSGLNAARFFIEHPELLEVDGVQQCLWGESTLGEGSRWRIGG